jgi:hypothetical protein
MPPKTGLDALLRPEDSVVVLIDHQPFQFANLHSHEPTMIMNNVIGLAKTARAFSVPTILTTVLEERGGYLINRPQDVFPSRGARCSGNGSAIGRVSRPSPGWLPSSRSMVAAAVSPSPGRCSFSPVDPAPWDEHAEACDGVSRRPL